jgi:hypothetical protein
MLRKAKTTMKVPIDDPDVPDGHGDSNILTILVASRPSSRYSDGRVGTRMFGWLPNGSSGRTISYAW